MGNPFRGLFWYIVNYLYFVLASVAFPSITRLLAMDESIIPILIQYVCCICLCYMGTKKSENIDRKQFIMYSLCVLIPLALKMIIENNTNVIDFFINSFCALFSMFLGYKTQK